MGLFDSTAEDMAASGESGAQTQEGSPLSINVAGGKRAAFKNNVINLQTVETDHGAIEAAFSLGEEMADVLGDGVGDLINAVNDISGDNLDTIDLLAGTVTDLSADSVDSLEIVADVLSGGITELNDSLTFIANNNNDLLAGLSRDSADTAKEAMGIVQDMSEDQTKLLRDISDGNNSLLEDVGEQNLELFTSLNANQAELTKDLISEINTQSSDGLDAIAGLAETKITDGQNMFIDLLKWVGVAVVLIVLVLGVVMAVIN